MRSYLHKGFLILPVKMQNETEKCVIVSHIGIEGDGLLQFSNPFFVLSHHSVDYPEEATGNGI